MRLISLQLEGFRGFGGPIEVDLDADSIIVAGNNGSGKTSLLDAVLWVLTGSIDRLGEPSKVVSMYSESGTARAVLTMREAKRELVIRRTFDGASDSLSVVDGDVEYSASEAEPALLRLLWPDALASDEPMTAFNTALTQSVYLQQDLVRDFVEAKSEEDRFDAVSELVGSGRVTDLQRRFDQGRTAWSRVTNVQREERDAVVDRVHSLDTQLSSLTTSGGIGDLQSQWSAWWRGARPFLESIGPPPSVASPEAASAIDIALKALETRRRAERRRAEAARDLQQLVSAFETQPPDIEGLRHELEQFRATVARARNALAEAEARAADIRRKQIEEREKSEELRNLAVLALRHLDSTCPVCGQEHRVDETRRRLEEIIGDVREDDSSQRVASDELVKRANELARVEGRLERSEENLDLALEDEKQRVPRDQRFRLRMADLDLFPRSAEDARDLLAGAVDEAEQVESRLTGIQQAGEELSLEVARAGERARRDALEKEVAAARNDLDRMNAELVSRDATSAVANDLLEALRSATTDLVDEHLKRVQPHLQDIWSAIDPHPTLDLVEISASFRNRRGRMSTSVTDHVFGARSGAPATVLSSSQLNAFAVALFLAFNLELPNVPLRALLLDDPLQSLDDINLLGLVDVLRRAREHRQLFISTHDERFSELLARKLRPVASSDRTIVIELDGWSRQGPTLTVRDVAVMPSWRIAAS